MLVNNQLPGLAGVQMTVKQSIQKGRKYELSWVWIITKTIGGSKFYCKCLHVKKIVWCQLKMVWLTEPSG
jgi:hypothetical protein